MAKSRMSPSLVTRRVAHFVWENRPTHGPPHTKTVPPQQLSDTPPFARTLRTQRWSVVLRGKGRQRQAAPPPNTGYPPPAVGDVCGGGLLPVCARPARIFFPARRAASPWLIAHRSSGPRSSSWGQPTAGAPVLGAMATEARVLLHSGGEPPCGIRRSSALSAGPDPSLEDRMPQPASARKGDRAGYTCVRTGFLEGYTVWAIGWSQCAAGAPGASLRSGASCTPSSYIPTNMPPLRGLCGLFPGG
ncbi:uncharacterized protein BDW43DRAFT_317593 [Aspergillus alliaceus]|uniref:uncharacterized protein n=1 Tax=Petromyces alliaceus TaxID=209559 RepID=UPI0012A66008|nr:uncharacterized protein BDW43DRAFT_317593 [Aspergillus alliaceus]KAB8226783.1 hypothetical protein BDW43DRAFT_317593 [Aspergillus alliaceus]